MIENDPSIYEVNAILPHVEKLLGEVIDKTSKKAASTAKATTLDAAVSRVIGSIGSGDDKLLTLGIPDLDYAIGGGIQKGEMLVIGARPSHGKSAIALQMCHHMTECGLPVLIVSQEMSESALGKRTLQYLSEIPQDDWEFSAEKLQEEANEHFRNRAQAYILETIPNAIELCETATRMQRDNGIQVVFIDYAQIVQGVGKSQYERVTDTSSRLRRLATETGLAIIVLAQLSREVEKRPEFHPTGKDLKDSGQIEQDADVVLFAVWPYKLDPKKDRNHYQFLVEKNRNRQIRKHGFDVHFQPERQRYLEACVSQIESEYANDFR